MDLKPPRALFLTSRNENSARNFESSVPTHLYLAKNISFFVPLCYAKRKRLGVFLMARPRLYKIQLTQQEREILDKTIKNKNTCKTVLKRCQILRELDDGHGSKLTYSQIAHTYAVCPATVENTARSYLEKGIQEVISYHISPNSANALRKTDGRAEARILQIACSEAPQGHSRWTLELLEEKARVELETPVSRETIRRTLKKTNFDLTAATIGASHQRKMPNS